MRPGDVAVAEEAVSPPEEADETVSQDELVDAIRVELRGMIERLESLLERLEGGGGGAGGS